MTDTFYYGYNMVCCIHLYILHIVLFFVSNIYTRVFANRDRNLIFDTEPQGGKIHSLPSPKHLLAENEY